MAYRVFWKYNNIYIKILDGITMCTEFFKVIRCQYLSQFVNTITETLILNTGFLTDY